MADERTRLILTPNKLPGYEPKRMLGNIEQPKRDYVKYMFVIEIAQTKGNINESILSIDLIGRYGRTSVHRLNMKSDKILPLEIIPHPNIFELTMLDVGLLHEYELKLENKENDSAYFISTMYIYRGQYYEIDIQQWIENNQILKGNIRLSEMPIKSILLDKNQLKTSFILWITVSELIKKEIILPIKFQFNCQNISTNSIEETITIRPNFVSVLAISTSCKIPINSVILGYNRKLIKYCLAKEIVILDVLQGQYFYFQFDNEFPKSTNEIDFYSFIPKQNDLSSKIHHFKHYIISILTSEKNLSEKHILKIVLRGERGLTSMLLLHNSSWNKIPFQAKHKDKFLLLASDIGKIKGLTLFHASEKAKFYFDIIELFVPDTKTCIRLRGKYEIFNEIIDFNCQESQIVYIIRIKSGFSTLNETADIILTLIGEESSIESILLTCDNDTKPFHTGQLDTFYIPTKKLGKIRAVDIRCSNVDMNCKWFCETIYVHDTVYNIKSNYVINRWCGDHQESDLIDTSNPTNKTTLMQPTSTKLLTNFLLTIKTGIRTTTNPMLTPSIYIFFAGQYGSSPVIHLNELIDRIDLFQSLKIDEFTFTIPDTDMPDIMRIWNTEDLAPWTCEYIDIKNLNNSKTVHFPMGVDLQKIDPLYPSYIDLQVDIGRVILSLPGPRDDAAYPSYELIVRTTQAVNLKDKIGSIQLKGDRNQSKIIPLIKSENNDPSKTEKILKFLLYGICSLGELKEILIYFNENTKLIYEYIIIYDYLTDKYYGTKINKNEIYHKYKLGIINPNHLNEELNRIETEFTDEKLRQSDPIYRILYKTQTNVLTNITKNSEILIRLIGDKSTSFFSLEHTRQLTSGSINEYFYRGNEYINGVTILNKIDLQLLDDENTQWACESIEIQDLKTDNIITFPINDIIESTIKTNKQKITTWKSGVKSGIIYLIRIRTGQQGASLNFRFGSVYSILKLYGDSGVSNEIPLHIPFEQLYYLNSNQIDTFEIGQNISVVGQISSIDIYHNGKKEDFWWIDWIDIKDTTINKSFHFIIEKCLNKDLGTNLKVLHISADVSTRKSVHELGSIPNYTIRVKTGGQTTLHTEETSESAVVSIVLIDSMNDSIRIPLERINSSARRIFQPGQEDRFDISITPMLELKVLQIYFNGTFSWFCERITVTDQISGLSYRFDVEQWFREKTNDNPVNVLGQREDDIGWIYSVTVKTQAVLPAQTNLRGKIFLSIYGENSSLNDAILGSGRLMQELFHAGGEDNIELKSNKRLGEIHSIELRLEVAEWQSWLCDIIEILDLTANWNFLSRTMITKNYKFPINRWLGAHAMDKRTVIRSLINQEPGYAKMPTHIVHILTGTKNMSNEFNIQTNVYLQLFCAISNHVYGPILLDKSSNNTQPFRKGQIDEFHINDLSYCGEIKKIRLYHDGGKTTSWHCEWIKITNVHTNEIYEFLVEKILDEDLEEGSSNLILYSEKKDESNEGELPTPRTIISTSCHGWHKTLTFVQQSSYVSNSDNQNHMIISHMKFLMWYNSYAIYGAREKLILLKPNVHDSTVEIFLYHWPIDQTTMDECLQEWNTKDKCYNDIVHVRISSDNTKMDVYCTYAHRPMVRSFDLHSMSFINEHILTRDQHPPMDSESSYVMLNFNANIITAGYQGDYIPTIRATQGKTLLYALRQNSYFIGGFKYDGKAVFGVIETSERIETNRVSRLVMTCANRAEIVRKAILNCSTDIFDQSRSFVFHILTDLVDPIHMSNGSTLLFATFTTNNSSLTASAVCLFILDEQFYDVFTGPSKPINRRTSIINNEMNELIRNCSQLISSTIDRDMVESEKQFLSYLSNPLLIETMSTYIFTSINVIQYNIELYCLIIGTSNGRLLTAFTNQTFKTNIFEELTLPQDMRYSIKSITYQKIETNSYVIIVTNQLGYLVIKLIQCNEKLCFSCWTKDCLIRKISLDENIIKHHCSSNDNNRLILVNNTEEDMNNHSLSFDWSLTHRVSDEQSNNKVLFYIVAPMSFVVFILSMLIIILLTKSNRQRKRFHQKTKHLSSFPINTSHIYTNDVLYRTNNNKLFVEKKNQQQRLFPIKSDLSIRPIIHPAYSTSSSHSLPPLILSSPSPPPPFIPLGTPQPLSVRRLCRSYV